MRVSAAAPALRAPGISPRRAALGACCLRNYFALTPGAAPSAAFSYITMAGTSIADFFKPAETPGAGKAAGPAEASGFGKAAGSPEVRRMFSAIYTAKMRVRISHIECAFRISAPPPP